MINLYEKLNSFEDDIDKTLNFYGFCIFTKHRYKSMITEIYNSLPRELHVAKEYLKQISDENVFSLLTKLDYIAENAKSLSGYIFIKKDNIISIIDKIYAALPNNISEARSRQ